MIVIDKKIETIDWPAENFTIEEIIKESDYATFMFSDKLVQTLEIADRLREEIGEALFVSDACRFHGSETSQHFFKQFNALDLWAKSYTSVELMKVVEKLDLGTGRGLYPNHRIVHLDCRRGKSSKEGRVSRWYRLDERNINRERVQKYYTLNKHYFSRPFNGLLEK